MSQSKTPRKCIGWSWKTKTHSQFHKRCRAKFGNTVLS